jgi:NTP pyrophosphatase (non-canonical NTP hydrolase)
MADDDWVDEYEQNRKKAMKANFLNRPPEQPMNRITLEDVENFRKNPTIDNYQEIAVRSAIYPGQGFPMGLLYCGLKLSGEAGEVAQHLGKAMRDDGYTVTSNRLEEERHHRLVGEIGGCLWYLSALCKELGIQMSEAAEYNLVTLEGRTNRGTLHGDGDNR